MIKGKKILFVIADGMADLPMPELNDKTVLDFACTPNMDWLSENGVLGLAKTVPDGLPPGSDVANLSLFGYNPKKYFTGRAPLEAANLGISLGKDDVAFRCNIVNIQNNCMTDFSAGHIDTEYSRLITEKLNCEFNASNLFFYPGVSYRNIMVWKDFPHEKFAITTPPHDIQDKDIADYLPCGEGSDILNDVMRKSFNIIKNITRIHSGTPTAVWLWGAGRKPDFETFISKYGLTGSTISAVDLIHGIGKSLGLDSVFVEGATGYIDTNYAGKAAAALKALEEKDFIFLHIEAPDESGHEGNLEHKLKSIQDIDSIVLSCILKELDNFEDITVVVTADHPTPIVLKTHTSDPVPFCVYRNKGSIKSGLKLSEKNAKLSGLYIHDGYQLLSMIIHNEI